MPLSDYGELLEWIKPLKTPGMIVEIGGLIGNGTRQLAEAFPEKAVWVVDTFDIYTDKTANADGVPMSKFYESELAGRSQRELFDENTKGLANVMVFEGNSRDFRIWEQVFLTIIDGEHTAEAVRQDFENARRSRFIAFHDYNHDIPELTKAIDEITEGMQRHVLPCWLVVAT